MREFKSKNKSGCKKSKFDIKCGNPNDPTFPLDLYKTWGGFPPLYKAFTDALETRGWNRVESHKFRKDFPGQEEIEIILWIVDGEWFFIYQYKPEFENKKRGPNSWPFNVQGECPTGVLTRSSWIGPHDLLNNMKDDGTFMSGIYKALAEYITVLATTIDDYI